MGDNTVAKFRVKGKRKGTNAAASSSGSVPPNGDASLFRNFVPLPNFLPGRLEYQNSCFIASVVNMSAWIPAIVEELGLQEDELREWSEEQWKQVIVDVRTRWNGKYRWTSQSHGQDDVAELLGDIIFPKLPGNFQVTGVRQMNAYVCGHSWETRTAEMMAVLSLPPRVVQGGVCEVPEYSIDELL